MEDLIKNTEKTNSRNETVPGNAIQENNRFQNNPGISMPTPGQFYSPAGTNQGPLMPRNNLPPQNMNRPYPQNSQPRYDFPSNPLPGNYAAPGKIQQPMPMLLENKSSKKYLWLLIPCILLFICNIAILTIYLKSEKKHTSAYTDLANTVAVQNYSNTISSIAETIVYESLDKNNEEITESNAHTTPSQSVTNHINNNVTDNTNKVIVEPTPEEPEGINIKKHNKITISYNKYTIEYTLTDVVFENEVYSTSDNMFADYFPDIEGESYIVAKITIKNIGGDSVSYNIFDDIEVVFDNKFKYSMQQLDLESSVMSKYWSCQPLKSIDIYWVQSVPDDVKSMGCNITFKVGDTTYKY